MKTNSKAKGVAPVYTGGGARASNISPELQLRRAVLTNFLFEDLAYESGDDSADNISALVPKVSPRTVAEIAKEARTKQYLRHMPLYLVREMAKHDSHRALVQSTLPEVIQRADELSEFLAIYWKDKKQPLAAGVRKGLAKALAKFNEFQLSRYAGESKNVKLKDVIKLVHPKPKTKAQAMLWKSVIEGTLKTADTWEAELSENGNTKESWTRLLREKKLGGLALLRNLRNIQQAGVDEDLIEEAIATNPFKMVLPFRFMTAVKYAPRFARDLEKAMLRQLDGQDKLPGKTVVVVDVSGSMSMGMSGHSENTRQDIANSLAVILRSACEEVVIYCTAGNDGTRIHKTAKIENPRIGFELCKQITEKARTLGGGGIFLRQCTEWIGEREEADRLIVISDSQDCDSRHDRGPEHSNAFGKKFNYVIDIAAHKNGIGYNKFNVINGFSEKTIDFIKLYEDLMERAEKPQKVKRRLNIQ